MLCVSRIIYLRKLQGATMPKVNFMHQSLQLVSNPQEERKTLARELFLRKPGMTLTDIARQVGVHRKQVARWRDKDGWKLLRIDAGKESQETLGRGLETPREAAVATAKLATKIRKGIAKRVTGRHCHWLDPSLSGRKLQDYLVALGKVYELQKMAYRWLV